MFEFQEIHCTTPGLIPPEGFKVWQYEDGTYSWSYDGSVGRRGFTDLKSCIESAHDFNVRKLPYKTR